jgi:hypothetical protein
MAFSSDQPICTKRSTVVQAHTTVPEHEHKGA